MTVNFKYNIGDMVTLIKLPDYLNLSSNYYKVEFRPKQYKIDGYKFVINEDGKQEILYRLYAYCDDYLEYHNWITEDHFEGTGNSHSEEINFISIDGEELKIGDIVYTNIYYGRNRDYCYMSPDFTFARKVKIKSLIYSGTTIDKFCYKFYGDELYPKNGYPCYIDGFVSLVMKNVTEQFVIDYVKASKELRENPSNEKISCYDERKKWLNELGVYDDVCKLYNQKSTKQSTKKKEKKQDSVKNILSNLSEDQKREMLKLLSKTL